MFHYHRKAKEASDAKRKRNTTHDRKNEGQRTDSTNCSPMIKETCSICMDPIICRGILAICNHFFCFHCIYEWSKMTNTCPLCKSRFRCISKINLESFSPEKQFRVKDRDQKLDVSAEDYELALELENEISTMEDRDSDYQMESENETNSSGNLISADANDSNDSFVTNDDSIYYDNDSFDCYDDSFIDYADSTQHLSNFSLSSCFETVDKEWHFPYSLRERRQLSETTTQSNSSLNHSPMLTRSKFINNQNILMETRNALEGSTSHSMRRSQRAQHLQAENQNTNTRMTANNLPVERNFRNMQPQINKEEQRATLEESEIFTSSDDDVQPSKFSRKQRRKFQMEDDSLDAMTDNAFGASTSDLNNEALNHSDYDEVYHRKRNHDDDDDDGKFETKEFMTSPSVAMISCVTKDSTTENWKSRDDELEMNSLDHGIFAEKDNDCSARTLCYRSKLRINPPRYLKGSINRPDYEDSFIYSSDDENCFHLQSNYEYENYSKAKLAKETNVEHRYEKENWDNSSERVISSKKKKRRLALSQSRSHIPCGDTLVTLQCMGQSVNDAEDTKFKANGEKRGKSNWQRTVTKTEAKISEDLIKGSNDEKRFGCNGIKEVDTSDSDILDNDEETTLANTFVPRRQKPRFHTIVRRKQNIRMPRYDF